MGGGAGQEQDVADNRVKLKIPIFPLTWTQRESRMMTVLWIIPNVRIGNEITLKDWDVSPSEKLFETYLTLQDIWSGGDQGHPFQLAPSLNLKIIYLSNILSQNMIFFCRKNNWHCLKTLLWPKLESITHLTIESKIH